MNEELNDALIALGLTSTQSLVYSTLLASGLLTGYRVSQKINRPTANTYKALESLESMGLVYREDGKKRYYKALPYDRMIDMAEKDFKERKENALTLLSNISAQAEDARVYSLNSTKQIDEQVRDLLRRAKKIVVMDVFPSLLNRFLPEIRKAAANVPTVIKVYKPIRVKGAKVFLETRIGTALNRWDGQILTLIIDAKECVILHLSQDCKSVNQAIWSRSGFLAQTIHDGILSEITVDAIRRQLTNQQTNEQIIRTLDRFRQFHDASKSRLHSPKRMTSG